MISFIAGLLIILSSAYFAVPSNAKEKYCKFQVYGCNLQYQYYFEGILRSAVLYNPAAAYFIDNSNS